MNKYKRLLGNTFLFFLSKFSSKFISIFLLPLFTSVLTTEEYGIIDTISITVTLLTPILTAVMSDGVLRFCLDKNYDHKEILTIGLSITLFGSSIVLLTYPVLINFSIGKFYWWFFLEFVSVNIHTILMQYIKGIGRTKLFALSGVLSTLFVLSLDILFLIPFDMGMNGYFLALILGHFAVSIVICFCVKIWESTVNPLKIKKKVYTDLLSYTCPMIPNSISWWISNSSDKYILLAFSSVSVVGIYSMAYKLPNILSIISTIFMGAWHISAVENFGSKESKIFFEKVYICISSFVLVASTGLVLISKPFAYIMYQNDFFNAWKPTMILILAFAFHTLSGFLGTVYTSAKKTKMLFISTIIAAIANIVFNFLLIPKFEMLGAALATFISYFLVWIIRLIHSKNLLSFNTHNSYIILVTVIIVLQIIFALIDTRLSHIIAIVLCIIALIIVLMKFKKEKIFGNLIKKQTKKRISQEDK